MYYTQPLPYRVVVLPLVDQRPLEERHGKKAPAMFLLLWNRRVGDYYTGDHVFGGEVAKQLAHQLSEYLRAANVFAHVVSSPSVGTQLPDVNRVQRLAQEHAADYVLTGELEHFFGSQHQHFSMFVLPLYFINTWGWEDSKTLPWGQTTVQITLYDGTSGDILWRQRFEAQETLPRETQTMSEAALESFASMAGRVTAELRGLPFDSMKLSRAQ